MINPIVKEADLGHVNETKEVIHDHETEKVDLDRETKEVDLDRQAKEVIQETENAPHEVDHMTLNEGDHVTVGDVVAVRET